ncbi:hypothetical protein FKM82_012936 [Ascaphus truei]
MFWSCLCCAFSRMLLCSEGKVKAVSENYTVNYTSPSPGYDCHISANCGRISGTISHLQTFELTQYYVYELHNGIAKRPRQLCPYVIVAFQYKEPRCNMPVLMDTDMLGLNNQEFYNAWKGQMFIQNQLVCDLALTSPSSYGIPSQLSDKLEIKEVIRVSELREKLPEGVLEKSDLTGKEVFCNGFYYSFYQVITSNVVGVKLNELTTLMKDKELAIIKFLNDQGFLILVTTSALKTSTDLLHSDSSCLAALFLFPHTKTLHKTEREEWERVFTQEETSLKVTTLLPGLRYAISETCRSRKEKELYSEALLERYFKKFALLQKKPSASLEEQGKPKDAPSLLTDVPHEGTSKLVPERCSQLAFSRLKTYVSAPVNFCFPLLKASDLLAGEPPSTSDNADWGNNGANVIVYDSLESKLSLAAEIKVETENTEGSNRKGLPHEGKRSHRKRSSSGRGGGGRTSRKKTPSKGISKPAPPAAESNENLRRTKRKRPNSEDMKQTASANRNKTTVKLANAQCLQRRKRGAEVLTAEFVPDTQTEMTEKVASGERKKERRKVPPSKRSEPPTHGGKSQDNVGTRSRPAKRKPSEPATKGPSPETQIGSESVSRPVRKLREPTAKQPTRKMEAVKQIGPVAVKSSSRSIRNLKPSITIKKPCGKAGTPEENILEKRISMYESHALNLLADLALNSFSASNFPYSQIENVPLDNDDVAEKRDGPEEKSTQFFSDHRYYRGNKTERLSSPVPAVAPKPPEPEEPIQTSEEPKDPPRNDNYSCPVEKTPSLLGKESSTNQTIQKVHSSVSKARARNNQTSKVCLEHSYSLLPTDSGNVDPVPDEVSEPGTEDIPAPTTPPATEVQPQQNAILLPEDVIFLTSNNQMIYPTFRNKPRSVLEVRDDFFITCNWDAHYDFDLDSKFTCDPLEKTINRALHGPWNPHIKEKVEDVKIILHMWIALFYSKANKPLNCNSRKVVEHSNPAKYVSINTILDPFNVYEITESKTIEVGLSPSPTGGVQNSGAVVSLPDVHKTPTYYPRTQSLRALEYNPKPPGTAEGQQKDRSKEGLNAVSRLGFKDKETDYASGDLKTSYKSCQTLSSISNPQVPKKYEFASKDKDITQSAHHAKSTGSHDMCIPIVCFINDIRHATGLSDKSRKCLEIVDRISNKIDAVGSEGKVSKQVSTTPVQREVVGHERDVCQNGPDLKSNQGISTVSSKPKENSETENLSNASESRSGLGPEMVPLQDVVRALLSADEQRKETDVTFQKAGDQKELAKTKERSINTANPRIEWDEQEGPNHTTNDLNACHVKAHAPLVCDLSNRNAYGDGHPAPSESSVTGFNIAPLGNEKVHEAESVREESNTPVLGRAITSSVECSGESTARQRIRDGDKTDGSESKATNRTESPGNVETKETERCPRPAVSESDEDECNLVIDLEDHDNPVSVDGMDCASETDTTAEDHLCKDAESSVGHNEDVGETKEQSVDQGKESIAVDDKQEVGGAEREIEIQPLNEMCSDVSADECSNEGVALEITHDAKECAGAVGSSDKSEDLAAAGEESSENVQTEHMEGWGKPEVSENKGDRTPEQDKGSVDVNVGVHSACETGSTDNLALPASTRDEREEPSVVDGVEREEPDAPIHTCNNSPPVTCSDASADLQIIQVAAQITLITSESEAVNTASVESSIHVEEDLSETCGKSASEIEEVKDLVHTSLDRQDGESAVIDEVMQHIGDQEAQVEAALCSGQKIVNYIFGSMNLKSRRETPDYSIPAENEGNSPTSQMQVYNEDLEEMYMSPNQTDEDFSLKLIQSPGEVQSDNESVKSLLVEEEEWTNHPSTENNESSVTNGSFNEKTTNQPIEGEGGSDSSSIMLATPVDCEMKAPGPETLTINEEITPYQEVEFVVKRSYGIEFNTDASSSNSDSDISSELPVQEPGAIVKPNNITANIEDSYPHLNQLHISSTEMKCQKDIFQDTKDSCEKPTEGSQKDLLQIETVCLEPVSPENDQQTYSVSEKDATVDFEERNRTDVQNEQSVSKNELDALVKSDENKCTSENTDVILACTSPENRHFFSGDDLLQTGEFEAISLDGNTSLSTVEPLKELEVMAFQNVCTAPTQGDFAERLETGSCSVVEHLTADQEVSGSNPAAPFHINGTTPKPLDRSLLANSTSLSKENSEYCSEKSNKDLFDSTCEYENPLAHQANKSIPKTFSGRDCYQSFSISGYEKTALCHEPSHTAREKIGGCLKKQSGSRGVLPKAGGYLPRHHRDKDYFRSPRNYGNFTITKYIKETGRTLQTMHRESSFAGSKRMVADNITQNTLDLEHLRFINRLKGVLRNVSSDGLFCKPSFQSMFESRRIPSCSSFTPKSRNALLISVRCSDSTRDSRGHDGWRAGTSSKQTVHDDKLRERSGCYSRKKARTKTRRKAYPYHFNRLKYENKPDECQSDISVILEECVQSNQLRLNTIGLGKAVMDRTAAKELREKATVQTRKTFDPVTRKSHSVKNIISDLCTSLRSRLNSVAKESGKRDFRFYISETNDDPFFSQAKNLLKKDGHAAIEPQHFCHIKDVESETLFVIIRNEDIISHIHKIPCLLQLKLLPNVTFAGVDNPEDIKDATYQELFRTGGFVVSDPTVLETMTLGKFKEVVSVLEKMSKMSAWKWLVHYRENRKLKEDKRADSVSQIKTSLLKSCQQLNIVDVLHYHQCDSRMQLLSEDLTCMLNLQNQHICSRLAVYLTDKPGTVREEFERNGILVFDVDTFIRTIQKLDARFQASCR